jgi:integrase/recombinase XerC
VSTELVPIPPPDPPPVPAIGPEQLLEHWLSGRSPHTVAAYRWDLGDFARHCGAASPLAALGRLLACRQGEANALVLGYRNALLERGLATATVGRRLAALRSAVKLANTLGLVSWQIGISAPRLEPRRDVRGPDRPERAKLWRHLRSLGDAPRARRDRALVALMFDLGLRRGEVVALDLADFDQVSGTLAVLGKGRREKALMNLPPATRAALAGWVGARGEDPGPLLVPVNRGGHPGLTRLTGRGVEFILRRLGVGAKLIRALRPHGLRHAAITSALDAGCDIRQVRKFSRHARIETVIRYDDARDDTAGAIAERVSRERK